MVLAQKFFEGARVGFVQKKERLGHNGLASEPRLWLAGKSFPRPAMVFFARVKQRHQRPAVNDAAFWHE
jgi:hypothetical protein